jgi:transposase InsO family protein
MEVRLAVAAYLVLEEPSMSVTELCRTHGLSRQTFYLYRRRFLAEGLEGLLPRSKRPHTSPGRTRDAVVAVLLAKHDQLVADGWDAGARSVRFWLVRDGVADLPSARTIHTILATHGRALHSPRKRPRSSYKRFAAMEPNGIWQIDGKRWQLADGTEVAILRVLDDHSRLNLASLPAIAEDGACAWACMVKAMERHGKPAVVLSDNGSAFSARRRRGGAYSDFEARLALIGVHTTTASPHHPQTCGKKEREWQTMQRWLRTRAPATDLQELGQQLDTYDLLYNTCRPHQALGGATPQEAYLATPKAEPAHQRTVPSRTFAHKVTADSRGAFDIARTTIILGASWAGAELTYLVDLENVVIFHHSTLVGRVTLDRQRGLGKSHNNRVRLRLPQQRT